MAGEKVINHGCPSWFVPVSNNSNICECGESTRGPGRIVQCDPNTNQTLLLVGNCMDYNGKEDVVFIGACPYINRQKGVVDEVYVAPPKNASELNDFLCGGLNRTGVLCNQCQEGLGTAIFSYSMQCLPCMSSGLGWTLYIFLATFPTTILFLVVLIFQVRITSGPMNAYIFACQLMVSAIDFQSSICKSTSPFNRVAVLIVGTTYGIWNLDFFRYLISPFCASEQLSPLHVVTLEYVVAFYPLLLTILAYACIQLHARDCKVIVCLWKTFCKCFNSCRQRWGEQWDPVASLIHTFAAFLLLSYSKILFVSLQLLSYTHLYVPTGGTLAPPMRVYHDPSLEWFGDQHLPFALLAIFVLCIFIFFPALVLLLYPTKAFQKCLGCCGSRWLALHAFVDVFQGCYKNGTNGTRDCRYFAGLYLALRIVLLYALYGGNIFSMYDEMVSVVCLFIASLLFLLFRPYKDNFWLSVWDSTVLSLFAFSLFCNMYTRYIASVPIEIVGALAIVPLIYFVIFVAYKLLTWMKISQMCTNQHTNHPTLEPQEPDRLLHPEEYESDGEHKPLLAKDQGNYPQVIETETYPPCGNSQQPRALAVVA